MEAKEYYVIVKEVKGKLLYWSGNFPSWDEPTLFVTDRDQARKFETRLLAFSVQNDYKIPGNVYPGREPLLDDAIPPKTKPEIGDYVKGHWKDSATGCAYFSEGVVTEYPGGLFVQDNEDQGITPLKDFFQFEEIIKAKKKTTGYTTDPNDPELGHGVDEEPIDQHTKYLVLSDEERAKGFVRPVRNSYVHKTCGTVTKMGDKIAETYARNPKFYGATYCVFCRKHLPVSEFLWDGTKEEVGS